MNAHVVKSFLIVFGIIGTILVARSIVMPDSWGKYGHYRADYIDEEASRAIKYGQNDSCMSCHEEVVELKNEGKHKRLSCEMCHSPLSEHVKDGKKFADMHVAKDDDLDKTCLRCHQTNVIGRPKDFPTIDKKEHLKSKRVRADHHCNQCHTVHHPLETINEAKKLAHKNLREAVENE